MASTYTIRVRIPTATVLPSGGTIYNDRIEDGVLTLTGSALDMLADTLRLIAARLDGTGGGPIRVEPTTDGDPLRDLFGQTYQADTYLQTEVFETTSTGQTKRCENAYSHIRRWLSRERRALP